MDGLLAHGMEATERGRALVAVSGGPDSTALLLAMHESGQNVAAAHFDHALRDGSDAVARDVAGLCARLGIRLISERRIRPLAKGSLQAAARAARYEFLERARAETGADVIALAHTADDLVEGAILHLLRGCGLAGMRGMPARRGRYVRPMLHVWRADVDRFLHDRGVAAHQDPSNRDQRFARVRVRHLILPALERDRPGIARRFHAAALAAARLQERAESRPTDVEVVKRLYSEAGGRLPGLSRRHLNAMLALARDSAGRGGRGIDLPGGLRFRIVGHQMQVVPTAAARLQPALSVSTCSGCSETGVVHLREGLDLRLGHRSPGLRIRPAGGRGSRKLQDVFVDARVPREDRDGWPIVFAGAEVAWVPGIALDAAHAAAPGQRSLHVRVDPMPAPPARKVVRLETPESPRGESS